MRPTDLRLCVCVCVTSAAVCVLEKMLLLDPEERVSASEALDLDFFTEFRDVDEETEALPYDQTMDNTDLQLDQWKREDERRTKTALSGAAVPAAITRGRPRAESV